MTLAALEQLEQRKLQARVCIIGAGAAGITLACELEGCGFDVLLLEAGTLRPRLELRDYYQGQASAPHPDPAEFRRAVFGGTTGLWGGRCVPFDPIDFESRPYVTDSGWPIRYEALAEHYPLALSYCDAGKFDFSIAGSLQPARPTISGFDGDDIVRADCIERYSLPTDFGSRYRQRIRDAANVTAVLGARCVRLVKAPGEDRIAAAEVADASGARREVRAEVFVLATGGIEVPRLLLASDADGVGFGNRSDHLGRHYMCHFENTCGRIVPRGARVVFRFERTVDGVYCRRQLRFTEGAQQRYRLLNTAFRLHFPSYSDATHGSAVMSGIYLAKSLLIPEYRAILQQSAEAVPSSTAAHLRNVITGLPQLLAFTAQWLVRIRLARRKLPYTLVPNADGSFPLEFNSEQSPLASNRITLAKETDRHGMPRVQIQWRLRAEDADSACRAFALLKQSLERSGSCEVQFDEARLRERIARSGPLGGHHIGTARMAASEAGGVVDGNCAVFGLPNLFVASSAVFPTSGHANPTLSIVALAVRLAAYLRAGMAP
jgi:choline dehydrogenase-like flavoprotein